MVRRCFALALAVVTLLLTLRTTAEASQTVMLDEIGVRYTSLANEAYATRDQMDARILDALGVSEQTLLSSMQSNQVYLIISLPNGHQISLAVYDKPAPWQASDYALLSTEDKASFLTVLARIGGYGSASWDANGYAFFSAAMQASTSATASNADLTLATLYLNKIYAFSMDLMGQEPMLEDHDLLAKAADRLLRLGAVAPTDTMESIEPLALPASTLPDAKATYTFQSHEVPLSLNPVPHTIGNTSFVLSGITTEGGYLRYSVNGVTSSRITADESGHFQFTVPKLTTDAENAIELTAFTDTAKTVVTFTVTVDWQSSPIVLDLPSQVDRDSITLHGLTLPGTVVQLTKGRGSNPIAVDEYGAFTITVQLYSIGKNDFSLQAQTDGYRKNTYDFALTRVLGDMDLINQLLDKVRYVDYQKLVAAADTYQDKTIRLSGSITRLDYRDGTPQFQLLTEQGNIYTVLCPDLLTVTQGISVELLGTLTGSLTQDDGYPVLELVIFMQ